MPAPFDDQRSRQQRHRMIDGDAQPEIVVFTNRQRFIESAGFVKQRARDHDRRRAHQAEFETALENIAGGFAMPGFGIDAGAVANPDLFGLANAGLGMFFHEPHLRRQLLWQP